MRVLIDKERLSIKLNGTKPKKAIGNGCTLYKKCGGCQLQNMDYQRQLRFKQATVVKLIGKY